MSHAQKPPPSAYAMVIIGGIITVLLLEVIELWRWYCIYEGLIK